MRGCKTSNPRSEYNERTGINCHKYNPGKNIWVLNENKLYFIRMIGGLAAFISKQCHNNVATLCNSADCEDRCLFSARAIFVFQSSLQSLKQWHFLFKFFAKLFKLSPARRSFFSTIDCSPFQNVYKSCAYSSVHWPVRSTSSPGLQFGNSNNITIKPLRVMSDHIFL